MAAVGFKQALMGIALGMAAIASFGETYRCQGSDGRLLYSNVPQGDHCQLVMATTKTVDTPVDSERFVAPKSAGTNRKTGRSSPTRAGSASRTTTNRTTVVSPNQVPSTVQMTRDQKRRSILEEELDIEQRNLAAAKTRLTQQEAQSKKTGQLSSTLDSQKRQVAQHEKNIEAIQRELSRIPNK